MLVFLLRRVATAVPLVFAITLAVFVLVRLLPGDPSYLIGGEFADARTRAEIRRSLGLDRPIYEQYLTFVTNLAKGDWGKSTSTGNPVLMDIRRTFPATLELATMSLLVAIIAGTALGCLAGMSPGKPIDAFTNFISALAISLPSFWFGLVAIFVLYLQLGWFPAPSGRIDPGIPYPPLRSGFLLVDSILAGNGAAFRSVAIQLIMPSATLGFVLSGPIVRQMRASFRLAMSSEYVEYARLLGFPRSVVLRYAFRNALLPVITTAGVLYTVTLGGAVLVETIFGWGGLGMYAVQAVSASDYFAIQGFVLVAALFSLIIYLGVDVLYAIADPRIRH